MLIELNEGTAARRRVPFRLFTSNGTAPDTGAAGDALIMGTNSAGTFTTNATATAIHAAQGMYYVELTQSECSVLGVHPVYHTVGDFCQHVANVAVVNFNPYSSQSNMAGNVASVFTVGVTSTATIAGVTNTATLIGALNDIDGSAVTLHAGVHSGATVAINDATGDVSSRFTVAVESGATIAGVTNTATLIGALNDIDGSSVTVAPDSIVSSNVQYINNVEILGDGSGTPFTVA